MKERTQREVWEAALGELQLEVSPQNYETWLKDSVGLSYQNGLFIVGVPSIFIAEWLEKSLYPLIRKTLVNITGNPLQVQFQVYQQRHARARRPSSACTYAATNGTSRTPKLNPKYTFSSFIVGSCNRLAHAAALGVAEHPGSTYNPLFVYGGAGLGKTHLLHALGWAVLQTAPSTIYVTAEQFTNEFISAIRERKTEDFRNKYRDADVLLIDDIQFIAGKEQTQEGLFHTFNDLHTAGRQIVLSSDRSPKSLTLLEDRLRSRFEWGLIADIQPPDLETRIAILQTKAEEQRVAISPEVLNFIARRIQKNIRELEGALNRIVAYARLSQQTPTPELATQALAELADKIPKRPPTAEVIITTVAKYFRLDPEKLRAKGRDKPIALARQVAMYLLREETHHSWTEIGRELGGRDHSTILHGYEKIAAEINSDPTLRHDVLEIRELLYSKAE